MGPPLFNPFHDLHGDLFGLSVAGKKVAVFCCFSGDDVLVEDMEGQKPAPDVGSVSSYVILYLFISHIVLRNPRNNLGEACDGV